MTARYTLVQYVPDPMAEERMNVGVITWDDEHVFSHFLSNWRRAQSFGGEDVRFLKDFATEVSTVTSQQLLLPGLCDDGKLDSKRLEKMIGSWAHSIQFTEPRGSLKDAKALVTDIVSVFLRELPPPARRARGRRSAAKRAADSLIEAVHRRAVEQPDHYVKRDLTVEGSLAEHRYDVALANGKLYSAAQALSFQINESALRKEIDAAAWAVDDVRKKHRALPLAVVVLRPRTAEQKRMFDEASYIFPKLRAQVVTEDQLRGWAREQAKSI